RPSDVQGLRAHVAEGRADRRPGGHDRTDARARRAIPVLAAALGPRVDDGESAGVRGGPQARVHGPPQAGRGPGVPAGTGETGPRVPRERRTIRESRARDRLAARSSDVKVGSGRLAPADARRPSPGDAPASSVAAARGTARRVEW